jgi:hypothetical protein
MTRTSRTMILGLIMILVGFVFVPKTFTKVARAQTGCSAASLSGPYGIVGSGFIGGAPATFVGTFVYDGQGNSTGGIVLNAGGAIDHIGDVTGTYTIDATCNGAGVIHTIHHHPPVAHYHDMDLVVVDGGREILFQVGSPKDSASGSPPPGEVLSGFMKRQ